MARIALATQTEVPGGINPIYTAGTDVGATYSIEGDASVEVVNANAGTINVTIESGGSVAGLAIADIGPVAIPTGQRRRFGNFDRRAFPRPVGGADAGRIYVNLDIVSSVTAGAFR